MSPYVRTFICTPLFEMLIKMLHDGHKFPIEVCVKVLMQFTKDQEGSRRYHKVSEGSRRFRKVPEGSKRFKKVKKIQEGSRRVKKAQES